MPQIFGAMCSSTWVKSLTHALTVDAASARALKWQPTGGPTVASVPTLALSVAGALARSPQWRNISGSIGQELGAIGTEKPVSYLYRQPQAKGTWIHLWTSGTTQRYSRSVGNGLKSSNVKGEIHTLSEALVGGLNLWHPPKPHTSSKGWSWGDTVLWVITRSICTHTLIPLP